MGIRVYYSNGANYIPSDDDFICELSDDQYRGMKPVFDVLKVRTKIEVAPKNTVDLSVTTVESLVEIIYDLLPHQKNESAFEYIDELNKIVQTARDKRKGLVFYSQDA